VQRVSKIFVASARAAGEMSLDDARAFERRDDEEDDELDELSSVLSEEESQAAPNAASRVTRVKTGRVRGLMRRPASKRRALHDRQVHGASGAGAYS